MSKIKTFLKYLLGIFFVGAGVLHFVNPGFYLKFMPPYLPWPLALVYLSGLAELLMLFLTALPLDPVCACQIRWAPCRSTAAASGG